MEGEDRRRAQRRTPALVARPGSGQKRRNPDSDERPQNDYEREHKEREEDREFQDSAKLDHGHIAVAVVLWVAGMMIVIGFLVVRKESVVIRVDSSTMNVAANRDANIAVRIHMHVQTSKLSRQEAEADQRKHGNPETAHAPSIPVGARRCPQD